MLRALTGFIMIALCSTAQAQSVDRNTVETIVIIERGEVGFIYFGNRKGRTVGPGYHNKIPLLEKVAVIRTDALREDWVTVVAPLADDASCEVGASLTYNVADPRRAFEWRRANNLPMRQRNEWISAHSDYTGPAEAVEPVLRGVVQSVSTRLAACGALETRFDAASDTLIGRVNPDGTRILEMTVSPEYCPLDPPEVLSCHTAPRLSRSSFSSVPDNRRHTAQR